MDGVPTENVLRNARPFRHDLEMLENSDLDCDKLALLTRPNPDPRWLCYDHGAGGAALW